MGVAVNVGVPVEGLGDAVGVAVRVIMVLGSSDFLLKELSGSLGLVRPEGESSQNGNARLGLAIASKMAAAEIPKTRVVRNME